MNRDGDDGGQVLVRLAQEAGLSAALVASLANDSRWATPAADAGAGPPAPARPGPGESPAAEAPAGPPVPARPGLAHPASEPPPAADALAAALTT